MEVSAVQRFVRRTPRKARLVADSVTGMKVSEALAFLEFSPKHAARDVAKAIKSAAAKSELTPVEQHTLALLYETLIARHEPEAGDDARVMQTSAQDLVGPVR